MFRRTKSASAGSDARWRAKSSPAPRLSRSEYDAASGEKFLDHQRVGVLVQRFQGLDAAEINVDGKFAAPFRGKSVQQGAKPRRRLLSVQDHEKIHVVVRHAVRRGASFAPSVAAAERDGADRGRFRRSGKRGADAFEGVLNKVFNTGIGVFRVGHGRMKKCV